MRNAQPATLTPAELDLAIYPLARMPAPVAVKACVGHDLVPIKVDARAVAWTAARRRWNGMGHARRTASCLSPGFGGRPPLVAVALQILPCRGPRSEWALTIKGIGNADLQRRNRPDDRKFSG